MKIFDDIKDFFSIDSLLVEEEERRDKNFNEMNAQLNKLDKISKILEDETGSDNIQSDLTPWVYLKKNNFVDAISNILNGEREKK